MTDSRETTVLLDCVVDYERRVRRVVSLESQIRAFSKPLHRLSQASNTGSGGFSPSEGGDRWGFRLPHPQEGKPPKVIDIDLSRLHTLVQDCHEARTEKDLAEQSLCAAGLSGVCRIIWSQTMGVGRSDSHLPTNRWPTSGEHWHESDIRTRVEVLYDDVIELLGADCVRRTVSRGMSSEATELPPLAMLGVFARMSRTCYFIALGRLFDKKRESISLSTATLFLNQNWDAAKVLFEPESTKLEELNETMSRLEEYVEDVRMVRNKKIAHSDSESYLGQGPWPLITEEENAGFLRDAATGVDLVAECLGVDWMNLGLEQMEADRQRMIALLELDPDG